MTTLELFPEIDWPEMESLPMWPTPRANKIGGYSSPNFRPTLEQSVLMSSVGDSHAKISPRQAKVQASKAPAQGCGASTPVLLAKYDHAAQSWRTSQLCLEGDLAEFSETWPRSGTMRNGIAYQLPPLVPLTGATESGLWRIPTASEAEHGGPNMRDSKGNLHPTAQVCRWPTPPSTMYKGSSPDSLHRKSGADRSNDRLDHAVMARNGGQLNPMWVEWLMGFPLEWTALKPSEMPLSRKSRKS